MDRVTTIISNNAHCFKIYQTDPIFQAHLFVAAEGDDKTRNNIDKVVEPVMGQLLCNKYNYGTSLLLKYMTPCISFAVDWHYPTNNMLLLLLMLKHSNESNYMISMAQLLQIDCQKAHPSICVCMVRPFYHN